MGSVQLNSNTDAIHMTTDIPKNTKMLWMYICNTSSFEISTGYPVFPQLGWRCHPGDKCRLTALLGLKQKQETSQHIAEQQTWAAYNREASDLKESLKILDRIIFHSSQKGVWDHTFLHTTARWARGCCCCCLTEEPVIVLRSEVKQLKTKLPTNHDSALGMGTEHLRCRESNSPWMTNPGPPITTRGERSKCSVKTRQVLGQLGNTGGTLWDTCCQTADTTDKRINSLGKICKKI